MSERQREIVIRRTVGAFLRFGGQDHYRPVAFIDDREHVALDQSGLAQRIGYDWIRCFEKTIGLLECDHLFPKRRNGLLIPTPFLIASCLKFLGLGLALFGIHTRIDYPCERSSYPADEGNHYRGDYSGPFGRLTDHLVNQPIQHRFFLSLSSCGLFVLQLQAYAAQGKDLIF